MLTLVTGVPGAGKTLNTIREVFDLQQKEWFGRLIFYRGIKELSIPSWKELTDEQTLKWFELPPGSVVIVDEAQDIWPSSAAFGKDVPESITRLNTHRHQGFDIFLVTQSPMLVQAGVRRLVGRHIHYDRRFGQQRINRFTWQRVSDSPNDFNEKREAVKDAVVLDKKVFALYKSAEVHTHKRRYPFKVLLAAAFFVVAPILFYLGYKTVSARMGSSKPESLQVPASDRPGGYVAGAELWLPRVPGLPATAPIYDQLTKPKSYPRYNCVMPTGQPQRCLCYSQQATLLDVPASICVSIVERGLFDPAKPDEPQRGTPAAPAVGGPHTQLVDTPDPGDDFDHAVLIEHDWAGDAL